MVTTDEVRAIAARLPGVTGASDRLGFAVENKGKIKGFAWSWMERVHPNKARIPNDRVLAISVPSLVVKDMLVNTGSPKYFTEPHYNGFPAILVRLDEIEAPELEDLLIEGWSCKAPAQVVAAFRAQLEAEQRTE